jgi:hypothetical protein
MAIIIMLLMAWRSGYGNTILARLINGMYTGGDMKRQ